MRRIATQVAILAAIANPIPNGVPVSMALSAATTAAQPVLRLSLQAPEKALQNVKTQTPAEAQTPAQNQVSETDQIAATLAAHGLNPQFAAQYLAAQKATGTPWQLTAAVHVVETGQSGTSAVTSYAGAQGPMQFMPGTFRAYGLDADGDGSADITNVNDAILTGANYLRAGGAASGNYVGALLTYNHSTRYANHVLGIAQSLGLK